MDARSFVTVERSKILGTLEPSFGLFINYAVDPLTQQLEGPGFDERVALVTNQLAGDFNLAIGIADIVQFGVRVPVAVVRGDPDGPGDAEALAGGSLGDIAGHAKIGILDRGSFPIGIAIAAEVAFDTGGDDAFVSHANGGSVITGQLVLDFDIGRRLGLAVNGGARLRDERTLDGTLVRTTIDAGGNPSTETFRRADAIKAGNELLYGLGLGINLVYDRLDMVFETYGALPLGDGQRAMPLETLLALRVFIVGNSFFIVGNSFFTVGASRG